MSARQVLKDVLTPLGHPIISSRLPDQIAELSYAIGTREVAPQGTARQRLWTLDLYVLSPLSEPAAADDDLDAALVEVFGALDQSDPIAWTGAERGTAAESFNSFRITVTIIMQEE